MFKWLISLFTSSQPEPQSQQSLPHSFSMAPSAPKDAPKPVEMPAPVRVTGKIANINVVLPTDRLEPGKLWATDADDNVLSGPWPAVGTSDRNLAILNGNPDRDPIRRFGNTPFGSYEINGYLRWRGDAASAALFGEVGVLTMHPLNGEAARADANGRTTLLIHGGPDYRMATDGSLRIPDEAIQEIMNLIDGDPAMLRPRIRVNVKDSNSSNAFNTIKVEGSPSRAARSWQHINGPLNTGGYQSHSTVVYNTTYTDDSFFASYLYWYELSMLGNSGYDVPAPALVGVDGTVYGDPAIQGAPNTIPVDPSNWQTPSDIQAAEALGAVTPELPQVVNQAAPQTTTMPSQDVETSPQAPVDTSTSNTGRAAAYESFSTSQGAYDR